jgi:hypothetical protein
MSPRLIGLIVRVSGLLHVSTKVIVAATRPPSS